MTVNFQKRPIWEAVRELATQHEIRLVRAESMVSSSLGNAQTPVWATDGFLFVASSLMRSKMDRVLFTGFGDRGDDHLSLSYQVFADPKLQPHFSRGADIDIAQDDSGKNLKPQQSFPFGFEGITSRTGSTHFTLRLLSPAPNAKRLVRLRATMNVLQEQKTEVWELTDLQSLRNKSKIFVFDGVTCEYTIESFALTKDGYQLRIQGKAAAPTEAEKLNNPPQPLNFANPFRLHRSRLPRPRISLIDQNGRAFSSGGSSSSSGLDTFDYTQNFRIRQTPFRFNPAVPAARTQGDIPIATELRLEFPHDVALLKIPFEFTNLPLPQFQD